MGCGASQSALIQADAEFTNLESIDPQQVWQRVNCTLDIPKGKKNPNEKLVVRRSGWKTIRIFVSSTFKDFHQERDVLVKEVFPDLRVWCQQHQLHLVECDLRWGVPKDTASDLTLKTCLGEIDRCYQDNIMPFFLHMTSKRIGWIPLAPDIPKHLVNEYRWVFGLSITEMEIVHGAYRKANPNALFLLRDDSFIENLPEEVKREFEDETMVAPEKIKVLRNAIKDRFQDHRVKHYTAEYDGIDETTKRAKLKLDDNFRSMVFEFFKMRISAQYPLMEGDEDPLEKSRESHEAFMKSRCEMVLGRSSVLSKISDYVNGTTSDVPLLILGQPGMGKSSIMAKAADDTCMMAHNRKIKGGGSQGWYVFHHFVGAVPGSTSILSMLRRLLKEIGAVKKDSLPTDIDTAVSLVMGALNNPRTKPVIIFIDALNQFDDDKASLQSTWVPRKLIANVRCVFSMINGTDHHKNMLHRESKPLEVFVEPLSISVRQEIVGEYLMQFNKRLDNDQMVSLLSKNASENPLWLSIACEELRVFGNFRQVSDKINNLPDGLLEILEAVLSRFEHEGGGHLLVATLCLIEASTFGLLESELLSLLADEDNLLPPLTSLRDNDNGHSAAEEKADTEKTEKVKVFDSKLPALKWASVYRSLRPFLRPFGDSGEGRLDFYHRTLSKVVRKKYLKINNDGHISNASIWYHRKLADYFQASDNIDRKVEEYPQQLLWLHQTVHKEDSQARMYDFLCDWKTIDKLYDPEHSSALLHNWSQSQSFDKMAETYTSLAKTAYQSGVYDDDELCAKFLQIATILFQGGKYHEADVVIDAVHNGLESEDKLEPRKEADIMFLRARVWDHIVKLWGYMYRSQLPTVLKTWRYVEKAIKCCQELSSYTVYKQKYLQLMLIGAFHLSGISKRGGHEDMPKPKDTAFELIDTVQKICKEMDNKLLLAEAIMSKGVVVDDVPKDAIKLYNESLDIVQEHFGDYHPLMTRILHNVAISYEESGDMDKAYDCFYKKYLISLELYGAQHVKIKLCLDVLHEPAYKRVAKERGHEIPTWAGTA